MAAGKGEAHLSCSTPSLGAPWPWQDVRAETVTSNLQDRHKRFRRGQRTMPGK
jgi:hypothetical protein